MFGIGAVVGSSSLHTAYRVGAVFFVALFMLLIDVWRQRKWERPFIRFERALDRLAQQSSKWKGVHLKKEGREWEDLSAHFNRAIAVLRREQKHREQKLEEALDQVRALQSRMEDLQREREQYRHRIQELSILRELSERIGYSLDMQNIVEVITGSLGKLLDYSSISYLLWEGDKVVFRCHLEQSVPSTYVLDIKRKMLNSMQALRGKEIPEGQVEEMLSGAVLDETIKAEVGSFFNGPLVIRGETVGILNVASTKKQNYTESEMTLLYTITKQVSNAVAKLQNLLESEKGRLNAMVVSMVDGVLMTDSNLVLTVMNPMLKEMLGLADKGNVTMFDIVDTLREKIDFKGKLEESLKLDRIVSVDEFLFHGRFLQLTLAPVKDRDGESLGVVAIFHDITQTKELERLREEFTSMMVHELRSPLDGIRKIAEVLKKPQIQSQKETMQEFVGMIHQSASEMLELVGDLLDAAKIEAGKMEVHPTVQDIGQIIADRKKYFEGLARERGVELIDVPPPPLPSISCDAARIRQVLNNLLSNAIKFTETGGKVYVQRFLHRKGNNIHEEARELDFVWQALDGDEAGAEAGDAVVVAVTDTGIGMAPEQIKDVFNKFKQFEASVRSEKRGTGLGLSIAKGIVEAHGGKIWVSSRKGKGTTIFFTVPL